MTEEQQLLVGMDTYLAAGVHIGTQIKTKMMERFIFRVRSKGLSDLDVRKTDERIRIVAKFLARFPPEKILVVSQRQYGKKPAMMFAKVIGAKAIIGRFVPGTLTNPSYKNFIEPEVILLTDPKADAQALREAMKVRIPIVSLCDTDNVTTGVDLIIPANNRGKRSLALVYWLLARQVLRERGDIGPDEDIPYTIDDFETKLKST
ncbi:MAG: 30S ribosomal protein S2 [Candidatus Asgardarchaeia archaeon]